MNREEAIQRLIDIRKYALLGAADCEALEMAIKALEQQPCDDAISLTKEAYSDLCLRASKADDLQRALDMEKGAYNALVKNIQCEDAISRNNVITSICQYGVTRERSGKYTLTACEMKQELVDLIQSLPSVTPAQKPCDDAISRQGAISWLKDEYHGMISDESMKIYQIIDWLGRLPSVNPQPKTGHWIAEENEEMETIGYYCSECDLPMETEEKTRYCPNCGCRMVDPQAESEGEG